MPGGLNFKHACFSRTSPFYRAPKAHSCTGRARTSTDMGFSPTPRSTIGPPETRQVPLVKFLCFALSVSCALWKLLAATPSSCPMHKKRSDMHKISSDGSYVGRTYISDHDTCMLACNGHDGFEFRPSGGSLGALGGHSAGPARPFERCLSCPGNVHVRSVRHASVQNLHAGESF